MELTLSEATLEQLQAEITKRKNEQLHDTLFLVRDPDDDQLYLGLGSYYVIEPKDEVVDRLELRVENNKLVVSRG